MLLTTTDERELDYREADGIEVGLFWRANDNRLRVAVADARSGEQFAFRVEPRDALEAFRHPFVWVAGAQAA